MLIYAPGLGSCNRRLRPGFEPSPLRPSSATHLPSLLFQDGSALTSSLSTACEETANHHQDNPNHDHPLSLITAGAMCKERTQALTAHPTAERLSPLRDKQLRPVPSPAHRQRGPTAQLLLPLFITWSYKWEIARRRTLFKEVPFHHRKFWWWWLLVRSPGICKAPCGRSGRDTATRGVLLTPCCLLQKGLCFPSLRALQPQL